MKQRIRIVFADDVTMFLQSMQLLLSRYEQVEVVATATNGHELVEQVKAFNPDVVVTDIRMQKMNGIEATRQLLQDNPALPVIGLTQFEEEDLIVEMLETGAQGYLFKTNHVDELVTAIETVHKGSPYFCDNTSLKLSKSIAASKTKQIREMNKETFTEKELEIIQLICQEYSNKLIADKAHLATTTVERYRSNIKEKTGSKNMAGIVVYAIRNGIFKV